jgi:site-specific DNA-methyltransferase (adenine-specific)
MRNYLSVPQEVNLGEDLVIHGNCYELLQNTPENSVDLVLTDPPYVLNASATKSFKGVKLYGSDSFKEICNGYDVDLFLKLCTKVCKKMNVFVFCSNAQIPEIMQWALDHKFYATLLAWHKTNAIPFCASSWKSDLEFIIHIRDSGSFFSGNARIASKLYSSATNPSKYGHPTEKPIPLLAKLIQAGSKEGDFILDPFSGSGTSLVAGLKLKRKVLGFEIKKEYCNLARNRLRDFLVQGDLFL